MPLPARQSDYIKGTSGKPMLLTGDRIARSAVVHPQIPVPQGKRGVLWDWLGQLRHLPSPSVGIAPYTMTGLHIPVPGVSSRAIPSPDNTAHF